MKTIKKGDTLPCGGVVTFISSTGYFFTPKGGGSRQWVATQEVAKPTFVIDYAALAAAQDAAEKERDRLATPSETAAYFAAVAVKNAELAARCKPLEDAALAVVPEAEKSAWIDNLNRLKSGVYGVGAIESVTVHGVGSGHTRKDNGRWVWDTSVVTYDGGGSGYGRHSD